MSGALRWFRIEEEGTAVSDFYTKSRDEYTDVGYVCVWDDGKPLKVSYVSQAFRNLLIKNNLPVIRLHDIRHSVATSLLKKRRIQKL